MSTAKGFLTGIIVSAAAYAVYKALPKETQDELKDKTLQARDVIIDKAYDVAYAVSDVAGDAKDKAVDVLNSDQLNGLKDKAKEAADATTPYVDRVRDAAAPYVDKAADVLEDLRERFAENNIELTDDDEELKRNLKDLNDKD